MHYTFHKTVVIGFGGSVLAPERTINIALAKKFVGFVLQHIPRHRFVIVVGGGSLSRSYQTAASKVRRVTTAEKDWIGIYATRLHAEFLRVLFGMHADSRIIDTHEKMFPLARPVTIASGWAPGHSTDCIAAVCAKQYDAEEFICAGKPAYIYSENPDTRPKAKKIHTLSWYEYRRMIPKKWNAGDHMPIDPVASEFAEKSNLTGIVIDGNNIANFQNLLRGRNFKGTIVH